MMEYRNPAGTDAVGMAAESVTSDGPVNRPFSEGRPDRRASGRRARRMNRMQETTLRAAGDPDDGQTPVPIAENGQGEGSCGGGFLAGHSLAMAYFPDQEWDGIYEDEEAALRQGTLFAALDFPFCPGCRR